MVEVDDGGGIDAFMTLEQFETRLRKDWEGVPTIRALDQAVLAMIQTAHVGQVITWRMGWIFCAEDEQDPSKS